MLVARTLLGPFIDISVHFPSLFTIYNKKDPLILKNEKDLKNMFLCAPYVLHMQYVIPGGKPQDKYITIKKYVTINCYYQCNKHIPSHINSYSQTLQASMGLSIPRVSNFLGCLDLKTGTIVLGSINLVKISMLITIEYPTIKFVYD